MDKVWCDWRNPVAIVSSENPLSLLKMHHHLSITLTLGWPPEAFPQKYMTRSELIRKKVPAESPFLEEMILTH